MCEESVERLKKMDCDERLGTVCEKRILHPEEELFRLRLYSRPRLRFVTFICFGLVPDAWLSNITRGRRPLFFVSTKPLLDSRHGLSLLELL